MDPTTKVNYAKIVADMLKPLTNHKKYTITYSIDKITAPDEHNPNCCNAKINLSIMDCDVLSTAEMTVKPSINSIKPKKTTPKSSAKYAAKREAAAKVLLMSTSIPPTITIPTPMAGEKRKYALITETENINKSAFNFDSPMLTTQK